MPNYINVTPEQLQAERTEEARRVTQGYEIEELRAMRTGELSVLRAENGRLKTALEQLAAACQNGDTIYWPQWEQAMKALGRTHDWLGNPIDFDDDEDPRDFVAEQHYRSANKQTEDPDMEH